MLRGASWETADPEAGAVMECYCSDNPREIGYLAGSGMTDSGGNYSIQVSETCRFYTLAVAGEPAPDADSVSGTVLPNGTIRFEEPLYGKNLTGNLFFRSTGEIPTTPTHAGSPIPAGTRYAPDTPLSAVLVILALGGVGLAVGCMKK